MARTSRTSARPATVDRDAIIAAAVEAALAAIGGSEVTKPQKATKATKPQTERTYDLTKAATRSQVFRAFFAMAKAHHGLTFKADEWPTSGDVQAILDALS